MARSTWHDPGDDEVDLYGHTGPVPRQMILSYAREDFAVVAEMVADLRTLDHEVWLDQDLGGGQDWWDGILDRIRWCDAFLAVLSTDSLGSRACTAERSYAIALDRPVLPVMVGDVGHEGLLDEDLARRQRIVYRTADKPSTLRLLAAVQRLVPAPALPAVEPTPPPAPMAYFGALRAELDGMAAIDFERQITLSGRLSMEADDPDRHPELAALVQIFLARQDIASKVEKELVRLQQRLRDRRARPLGVPALAGAPPPAVSRPTSSIRTLGRAPGGPAGRSDVVVVEESTTTLVLEIENAGEGWCLLLRVDRGSRLPHAVKLDGRHLGFIHGQGNERWVGDHAVTVSRVPAKDREGSYCVLVRVGHDVVFEEEHAQPWTW